jgi:hypothetical protein
MKPTVLAIFCATLLGFVCGMHVERRWPEATCISRLLPGQVWKRTYEITGDPDTIDKQTDNLATELQRQTNLHPRKALVLSCVLEEQASR